MKPYNTEQTKKEEVREMFDNIAPKYDLLNHTLSMSIDRIWRRRVGRRSVASARSIYIMLQSASATVTAQFIP